MSMWANVHTDKEKIFSAMCVLRLPAVVLVEGLRKDTDSGVYPS